MGFSTVKKGVGINLGLVVVGSIVVALIESPNQLYSSFAFGTFLVAGVLALLNLVAAIVMAIVRVVKKDQDYQLTQAFLLSALLLLLVGFSFCLGGMLG